MSINDLFAKFSQGVNWNAFLYFIYKISATLLTFLLYQKLDSKTFSTFANINAVIFLLLLWIDFGFKKSIARFCPIYAQNNKSLNQFITSLLVFKITMLILVVPIYIISVNRYASGLHLENFKSFFYAGSILIILQGIISVIQLIYHAYFWQKQFNSLQAISLTGEIILDVCAVGLIENQYRLLAALLVSKMISRFGLLIAVSVWLPKLSAQESNKYKPVNMQDTNRAFVKHSAFMWFSTNIKSLTERNVLVPIFTHVFGPAIANAFKVANDGALLFYRMVVKSIGTADTALFSHIQSMGKSKETWQVAFKKLTTKIAALVLPLLGIVWVLYRYKLWFVYNQYVFHIFIIISISLLLEVLFSPYERILEVKRDYSLLLYAYVPYICMLILLTMTNVITSIGLLGSIMLIHGVRLVSSFIMLAITRIKYQLVYPFRFVFILGISISTGIYILRYIIIFYFYYIYP